MGLDVKGAISGAATGAGIAGPVGGVVGGALGLMSGLFGGGKSEADKQREQREAEERSWGYAKQGMGLQYQLNEQAADNMYKRNMQMWDDTNYEAQREHMENAGLSVGLMYGNGGGMQASTSGGQQQGVSGPGSDPVSAALQKEALGLQLEQIKSQNMLNYSQAAKNNAEAKKISGVDTKESESRTELNETNQKLINSEIEINSANITKLVAEGQIAMQQYNQELNNTEISNETKKATIERATAEYYNTVIAGIANITHSRLESKQIELVEKEVENFMYDLITKRMSVEVAEKQADAMIQKIKNDYEQTDRKLNIDQERLLKEWIYGGIETFTKTVETATDAAAMFTKVGAMKKLAKNMLKGR
jgi:hypothetical protein